MGKENFVIWLILFVILPHPAIDGRPELFSFAWNCFVEFKFFQRKLGVGVGREMLPCSTSPQLQMNAVIPGNSMHRNSVYYITWIAIATGLENDHVLWDMCVNNCLITGPWCEHGALFSRLKFLEIMHCIPAHCFTTVWNNWEERS